MTERLIQFFYLLGRDDLPLGAVEALVQRTTPGPTVYSNVHLEAWAREKVAKLLELADG